MSKLHVLLLYDILLDIVTVYIYLCNIHAFVLYLSICAIHSYKYVGIVCYRVFHVNVCMPRASCEEYKITCKSCEESDNRTKYNRCTCAFSNNHTGHVHPYKYLFGTGQVRAKIEHHRFHLYETEHKLNRIMIKINTKNNHGIFIIESILLALNKMLYWMKKVYLGL